MRREMVLTTSLPITQSFPRWKSPRTTFRSPYTAAEETHPRQNTRCSDTDNARARDSISGRQGSLTPVLAPARAAKVVLRCLRFNSRYTRNVTCARAARRAHTAGKCGKGGAVTGTGEKGRKEAGSHGGCEDRRAVARGE